jgi:hypothetical protein
MLRMGLAPCSPFSVDNSLMIAAAKLARQYKGVRLHTHLAENQVGLLNLIPIDRVFRTPFSNLMIAAAKLARQYKGVRLHTHHVENQVGFAQPYST